MCKKICLMSLVLLLGLSASVQAVDTMTVLGTPWGVSSVYTGACEASSMFDINDMVDLGINNYRLWGGTSRWEYEDDDGVYGSPTIAEIKANPDVINWAWWDNVMTNPPCDSDYHWSACPPDGYVINARQIFQQLKDNNIKAVVTLRNVDNADNPGWAQELNPPNTTEDWNEWWEHVLGEAMVRYGKLYIKKQGQTNVSPCEILNEAFEAAKGVRSEYYRDMIMSEIARAQVQCGDIAGALATYMKLAPHLNKPFVMVDIVIGQAEHGDIKGALSTIESVKSTQRYDIDGLKSDPFVYIAKAQAKKGDYREAFQTVEKIGNPQLKNVGLLEIARGKLEKRDFRGAMEIIRTITHDSFIDDALRDMVKSQAETGNFDTALEIFEEIESTHLKILLLINLGAMKASLNEKEEAFELLTKAMDRINSLEDNYKYTHLARIAGSFIELDDVSAAESALQEVIGIANKMQDKENKVMALLEIADIQLKLGNPEAARKTCIEAKKIAVNMEVRPVEGSWGTEEVYLTNDDYIGYVARKQADIGDIEEALKTVSAIESYYNRAYLLSYLAVKQRVLGDTENSRISFREAVKFANMLQNNPTNSPGALMLSSIARSQAQSGDNEDAKSTIEKALETAVAMADKYNRGMAVSHVITAQIECGDVDGALQWSQAQRDPLMESCALLGVAKGLLNLKGQK